MVAGLGREVRRALRFAGVAARGTRPEVGGQSVFEAGEGVKVGPDGAVEDRGDGGVVDAGEPVGLPQANAVQGGTEVEGDLAGRFDLGGGAWGVRPVVHGVRGGGAVGSGHTSSVGRRPVLRVVSDGCGDGLPFVGGPSDNGGNNQHSESGDAVATTIANYTPDLPPQEWAVIADFVRAAVTDCDFQTAYTARTLMVASIRHVHWCVFAAGLPLDRAVVFHRDTIAEYIAYGCPQMSAGSAGNRRSQLLRMSELLLPPATRTSRLTAMPASPPTSPYSVREQVALRSWAAGQGSQYQVVSCHVLLALGFGAGLSAAEVGDVQAGHLHCDTDGVLVEVVGKRARMVPVLAEWEPVLVDVADAAMRPDLYVFRPRRDKAHRNLVGNFIYKTNVGRVRPNLQRMRTTWIVTHLSAGSPIKALVEAAGVDSLEALTRYLRYVPDADINAYRVAFRAADGGAQ